MSDTDDDRLWQGIRALAESLAHRIVVRREGLDPGKILPWVEAYARKDVSLGKVREVLAEWVATGKAPRVPEEGT